MGLEDYKDIVATCAAVTTMGQMLAGTVICKDIYQKGSTKGFDPMPFVGGIGIFLYHPEVCVIPSYFFEPYAKWLFTRTTLILFDTIWQTPCFGSLLMFQYAWILGDPAMINVNIFGLLTNVAYISVFYMFSTDKMYTLGLVGKAVGFASIFLGYAQWEHPDLIEFRFGIIVTVMLLLLIASPLVHLTEILKTKSTEILPFPLILMGTLVSAQWLLYGLIIDNAFIIFQNGFGFVLSAVQLSLFAIFPSTPKSETSLSSSKKDK